MTLTSPQFNYLLLAVVLEIKKELDIRVLNFQPDLKVLTSQYRLNTTELKMTMIMCLTAFLCVCFS